MMQTILIALAVIAFGIVGFRLWQGRAAASGEPNGSASEVRPANIPANALLAAAAIIAALAMAGVLRGGGDGERSAHGAAPMSLAAPGKDLADVDTMIAGLSARLVQNPDDGEGFRMLGWSYLMTGRPQQALTAYRRAIALLPDDATVHAGYGEALVAEAGGSVPEEAMAAFDRALALDPMEPRARYFAGKFLAQNGRAVEALDRWIALANDSPADAAWRPDLMRDIEATAATIGVDVAGRLTGPAPLPAPASVAFPAVDPEAIEAAGRLPPAEQQAMIEGMVERLAARLAADPSDAQGWARLVRSRMVMGESEQAARDLARARRALASDRAGRALVEAVAAETGVPGR